MSAVPVCRVCLAAGNTTLRPLLDDCLIDVYKVLSKTEFNYEAARPKVFCESCYQILQRCYTFSQMAIKSEDIFFQINKEGLQATHEYITEKKVELNQQLSVTALQVDTIDGNATDAGSQVSIIDEPIPNIDIKEEVNTEQDELVEVWRIIEDSTDSQLTLDKDNSYQENGEGELPCNNHVEQTKQDNSKMTLCCNDCNKIFFNKSKLLSHIRNSHSQFKGNRIDHLVKQTRTRTRPKPFACKVCDKIFNYKVSLNRHMKMHKEEKKFVCNVCDKKLGRKEHLVGHMSTHTGVKAYACNLCDKRFPYKSDVFRHQLAHTGDKKFPCNVCDKRFYQKYILMRHMKIHTREKPLACNVCYKPW